MKELKKKVFQLIVDNNPGVLSRISGLFSRRGYNIESITAGVTADPRFTRITIVASGDDVILDQIEKQIIENADADGLMLENRFYRIWKNYRFEDDSCAVGFRSFWKKKNKALEDIKKGG